MGWNIREAAKRTNKQTNSSSSSINTDNNNKLHHSPVQQFDWHSVQLNSVRFYSGFFSLLCVSESIFNFMIYSRKVTICRCISVELGQQGKLIIWWKHPRSCPSIHTHRPMPFYFLHFLFYIKKNSITFFLFPVFFLRSVFPFNSNKDQTSFCKGNFICREKNKCLENRCEVHTKQM